MKYLASAILGVLLGAVIVYAAIVLIRVPEKIQLDPEAEPTLGEQFVIDKEQMKTDVEPATKLVTDFAGIATCVNFWPDPLRFISAEEEGFVVDLPDTVTIDDPQAVVTCKTDFGSSILLSTTRTEDFEQESYDWALSVSQNGRDWKSYEFKDSLAPVLGPSCEITEVIPYYFGEKSDQIQYVQIHCFQGDGSFTSRRSYVWDDEKEEINFLYFCDGAPNPIFHPRTLDLIEQGHEEDCTYFGEDESEE